MIVDSHCHASSVWYRPIESLLHEMDRNGVERAILIQIAGEYDNSYQQACVREHADRLASVVHLDDSTDTAPLEWSDWRRRRGRRAAAQARAPGADRSRSGVWPNSSIWR
jgi:L-fuconolactonase